MADGSYRNETGWAAGTKFGGSWGMYLQYTIEKPEVVNDQPAFTDAGSAWGVGIDIAKQGNGDYFVFDDLTTDKTVVLGMGRNYTDIGTVTAHYDAATRNISVTFATRDPYYMNQTHLYIDDVVPTVTAPGQYEFQYTVDAAADYYQTHSYTVNAGDRFDTNNDGVIDGPIYVAAHAHILSSGK